MCITLIVARELILEPGTQQCLCRCLFLQVQGDPADFPASWWEAKVLERTPAGKFRVEVQEVTPLEPLSGLMSPAYSVV